MYRKYAYSPKGVDVYGEICGRKFKRVGIVAAQMDGKIISPLQYEGTMDSSLFEQWFEQCLLPNLPKEAVIVMDNAAFHRKSRLLSLSENSGNKLVFLPPYSPELNSIENFCLNAGYKNFCLLIHHLMMLCVLLFRFVDYSIFNWVKLKLFQTRVFQIEFF